MANDELAKKAVVLPELDVNELVSFEDRHLSKRADTLTFLGCAARHENLHAMKELARLRSRDLEVDKVSGNPTNITSI